MDIKGLNLNTLSTYLNAYEWGKLSDDQTIDLFQALVDMGMIEHLRAEYTRVAEMLINNNRICADLNQLRQEYTAAGDSRLRVRYPAGNTTWERLDTYVANGGLMKDLKGKQ